MTPGNRGVGKARIGGAVYGLVWTKWEGANSSCQQALFITIIFQYHDYHYHDSH
jgi:hypothetical protein